jgi:hypothetical protein
LNLQDVNSVGIGCLSANNLERINQQDARVLVQLTAKPSGKKTRTADFESR